MASKPSAAPAETAPGFSRRLLAWADRFIPDPATLTANDAALFRSFVILHLIGPLLGLIICGFLFAFGGFDDWIIGVFIACVLMFWLFPFAARRVGGLEAPAFASVQLLVFVSLFGSYLFGGFNSPFAPWFVVAVVLAFLYAPRSIGPCLAAMALQVLLLGAISRLIAPPPIQHLAPGSMAPIFMVSALAATLYTSIISVLYTALKKEGSALAAEARRHRSTARQLRVALGEAKAANQQKSAFLARISHELRTPLNVVIGYSEMLVEDAAMQEKTEREQDLRRITEASRHLLSLVNNVVDLAHLKTDDAEIEMKPIDLDDFFERLGDSVAPLVARNGNALVREKSGPLGWMEGDPVKLRQCVLNLISNAGKFTSDGTVTLAAGLRRNSLGGTVVFEVRDDGIGLDDAELGRLFTPYRQASADTASQFGGSGLGLALTKRFCTLMGGSIEVQSRRRRGIDLPDRAAARLGACRRANGRGSARRTNAP